MQQVQNLVPGLLLVAGLLCLQYPTQCEAQPTGSRCPPVKGRSESCVCQVRKGFMVDLSSLSSTDGTPRYNYYAVDHSWKFNKLLYFDRFTNLNDGNDWLYSYNPCKPFTSSCGSDLHVRYSLLVSVVPVGNGCFHLIECRSVKQKRMIRIKIIPLLVVARRRCGWTQTIRLTSTTPDLVQIQRIQTARGYNMLLPCSIVTVPIIIMLLSCIQK